MRYCFVFSFIALLGSSVSFAIPPKDLASDAEAHLFYGDFFHSFRTYSYLEEQSPAAFNVEVLNGYLTSLFIIGGKKTIKSECDRFAVNKDLKLVAASCYLCGKHFVELKETGDAEKYLGAVTQTTSFFWPAQILRAANFLVSNNSAEAIKILNVADIKHYEKLNLADEFNLALARSYAAQNKFDDAVRRYQLIDGKSLFYIQALEETSWAFFKTRHFESAQVLLDVLIGNFETDQRVGTEKVSESTYYRARYLRAYLALSEKRTEGAAAAFADLRTEYEKSLARLRPVLNSGKVLTLIRDQNQKWTDVNNIPKSIKVQLALIAQWEGPDVKRSFENQILYQMALTRELNRTYRFQSLLTGDVVNYQKDIRDLQDKSWKIFAARYDGTLTKLAKDLETLKIKAELGRLEIVWLKRAEGVRSIDEVIDNYRQSARYIDEFIEK